MSDYTPTTEEVQKEAREALIEQATWALIDYDTDVADRGVSDEHYRERRADVERVFPILASRAPQPTEDEPLNVERENAAAEYTRRNVGGMQPVMTLGERVHDAFVSGAEWAAGFRKAPAEPAVTEEEK